MEVILYRNANDNNVVSKELTDPITYNCVARNTQDILNPQIMVTADNISDYNYMYIPRYGRYYYIDRLEVMPNSKWTLYGRVDVLKTYDTQIRALTGTVTRQETFANGYVPDAHYRAKGYRQIVAKAFPNAMENDNLILMTIG